MTEPLKWEDNTGRVRWQPQAKDGERLFRIYSNPMSGPSHWDDPHRKGCPEAHDLSIEDIFDPALFKSRRRAQGIGDAADRVIDQTFKSACDA